MWIIIINCSWCVMRHCRAFDRAVAGRGRILNARCEMMWQRGGQWQTGGILDTQCWVTWKSRGCEGNGRPGVVSLMLNIERCDMSLTRETTNTKHTHKWSEAQWLSNTIHTKLVSKTLINPDCDCGYVIYLIFNNAKGSFRHLAVCLLWWGVIHN